MTDKSANIGRRMAKGAAWMVLLRFGMRGLGFLSTVVLARLLLPEDFGIATLAAMSFGILEAMGEFRPDLALIREQNAERRHYDTVWTLTILRGSLMALILAVGAPFYAAFFDEPRLEPIVYIFAAMAFVEGFRNVGVVDFYKNLQLQKEFRFMLMSRAGGFVVTVALAIVMRNYWALVVGMVVGRTLPVALSYVMHPYRPRLSLATWREITSFSLWVMLNNILMYFYNRSDAFVIGKIVGAAPLGLYSVARQLSNLPSSELVGPIRQAIFPGYATMADDPEKMRKGFLDAFSLILLIGVPICIGIGLVADPLVKVLLGPNWLETIPLIQILVIFGLLTVGTANSGPIFLALGKPYILPSITGTCTVVVVPLLLWGVADAGPIGAAWAVTASAGLAVALNLSVVVHLLHLPVTAIFMAVWRVIVASGIMAAIVHAVELQWPASDGFWAALAELAALGSIGAAAYFGALLPLWRLAGMPDGAERHIFSAVRVKFAGAANG